VYVYIARESSKISSKKNFVLVTGQIIAYYHEVL